MDTLFSIHSVVRYLVLLAAIGAIITALLGWKAANPPRAERRIASAFVGLLDLQIVLGVLILITGFEFYGALTGHIFMMLLAAAAAHAAIVMSRRREPRSASAVRLIGFVVALVLIAGGVAAIGRTIV